MAYRSRIWKYVNIKKLRAEGGVLKARSLAVLAGTRLRPGRPIVTYSHVVSLCRSRVLLAVFPAACYLAAPGDYYKSTYRPVDNDCQGLILGRFWLQSEGNSHLFARNRGEMGRLLPNSGRRVCHPPGCSKTSL